MNAVSVLWLLIVVNIVIYSVDANWLSGNLCWSMPCLNGGSCFGSAHTYLCVCPINYSGALCEKRLGPCQENPCGNRGVCVEKSSTLFECRCYFDYTGPNCEEHVPKRLPTIWSSLLPSHTRALFNMLKQAYLRKAKPKSAISTDVDEIDFVGLLSNNILTSTIPNSITTAPTEIELTTQLYKQSETAHVISGTKIQLENIFPSVTTGPTSHENKHHEKELSFRSDYPTTSILNTEVDMTSTSLLPESMETTYIEENETITPTLDDETELTSTIPISTAMESLSTTPPIDHLATQSPSTKSIIMTTTNSMDYNSNTDNTLIDYDAPDYSESVMSSTLATSELSSSIEITTVSENAHSQLLHELCQQLLSHISANRSSSSTDASASKITLMGNNTADKLVYWLSKYLSSTTRTTRTTMATTANIQSTTVVPLVIDEIQPASTTLKRIEMDDALNDVHNNDN